MITLQVAERERICVVLVSVSTNEDYSLDHISNLC